MTKESKYKLYSVDDLVQDEYFRQWIISPDKLSSSFWKDFQKEFPEKNGAVDLASQIVTALSFNERAIQPEEYQDSLNYLKNYLSNKTKQRVSVRKISRWLINVAAILLLPLLTISIYQYVNYNTDHPSQVVQYIVSNGKKSKVILADGTNVWLNSGSKLNYIIDDNENERKVSLTGEAFFDVVKDEHKPFLVETKDYTVKVYGTRFNVNSYEEMDESETILEEGAISILVNDSEEVKMVPGQRFFLNEQSKYTLTQVNPDLYLSWKDNILKINNERLEDLTIRLERWYGVKIQVEDFERVKDLKYTLSIKTESLREMLELMKYVTPFEYKISGEDVVLSYQ